MDKNLMSVVEETGISNDGLNSVMAFHDALTKSGFIIIDELAVYFRPFDQINRFEIRDNSIWFIDKVGDERGILTLSEGENTAKLLKAALEDIAEAMVTFYGGTPQPELGGIGLQPVGEEYAQDWSFLRSIHGHSTSKLLGYLRSSSIGDEDNRILRAELAFIRWDEIVSTEIYSDRNESGVVSYSIDVASKFNTPSICSFRTYEIANEAINWINKQVKRLA